jgi:transposase
MDCPRCGSLRHVKSDKIQGDQRHRHKDLGRNYTVSIKSTERSQNTKRQALQIYLEGLGFCSIGRIFERQPRVGLSLDQKIRHPSRNCSQ